MGEHTKKAIEANANLLHEAGFSVFPVGKDKIPAIKWGACIKEQLCPGGFPWGGVGIGIATGPVSDLLVLDFDRAEEPEIWEEWLERARASVEDFDIRVPLIKTPGGGFHAYFRLQSGIYSNEKLAMVPTPPGTADLVIFETRGAGGYVVTPGGHPGCHPSGEPYEQIEGPELEFWGEIPPLTEDEVGDLLRAARMADKRPCQEAACSVASSENRPEGAVSSFLRGRPGDELEEQRTWADLLEPDGWTLDRTDSKGIEYWRRPGKDKGWSATVNFGGFGKLRVFSSSVAGLDPDRFFTKFGYLIQVRHAGDARAAAEALRAQGMGLTPKFDGLALQHILAEMTVAPLADPIWKELKAADPELNAVLRESKRSNPETTVSKLAAWAMRSGASLELLASIIATLSIDPGEYAGEVAATAVAVHEKPKLKGKKLYAARDAVLNEKEAEAEADLATGEPIKVAQRWFPGLERIVAHGEGEGSLSVFHYIDGRTVAVGAIADQNSVWLAHMLMVPTIPYFRCKTKEWWPRLNVLAALREKGSTLEDEVADTIAEVISVGEIRWSPRFYEPEDETLAIKAKSFNSALAAGSPILLARPEGTCVGFSLTWVKGECKTLRAVKQVAALLRGMSVGGEQLHVSSSTLADQKVRQKRLYVIPMADLGLEAPEATREVAEDES